MIVQLMLAEWYSAGAEVSNSAHSAGCAATFFAVEGKQSKNGRIVLQQQLYSYQYCLTFTVTLMQACGLVLLLDSATTCWMSTHAGLWWLPDCRPVPP